MRLFFPRLSYKSLLTRICEEMIPMKEHKQLNLTCIVVVSLADVAFIFDGSDVNFNTACSDLTVCVWFHKS